MAATEKPAGIGWSRRSAVSLAELVNKFMVLFARLVLPMGIPKAFNKVWGNWYGGFRDCAKGRSPPVACGEIQERKNV